MEQKCFATSVNRLPDAAVVQAQQVSVEKMQQSLPYRMN